MSYSVGLNEQALADLQRMPGPVQLFVLKSLHRLETDLQSESRPTTGLHAKGFLFELEYSLGDLDFYIDVLFDYDPPLGRITVFQILWEYV